MHIKIHKFEIIKKSQKNAATKIRQTQNKIKVKKTKYRKNRKRRNKKRKKKHRRAESGRAPTSTKLHRTPEKVKKELKNASLNIEGHSPPQHIKNISLERETARVSTPNKTKTRTEPGNINKSILNIDAPEFRPNCSFILNVNAEDFNAYTHSTPNTTHYEHNAHNKINDSNTEENIIEAQTKHTEYHNSFLKNNISNINNTNNLNILDNKTQIQNTEARLLLEIKQLREFEQFYKDKHTTKIRRITGLAQELKRLSTYHNKMNNTKPKVTKQTVQKPKALPKTNSRKGSGVNKSDNKELVIPTEALKTILADTKHSKKVKDEILNIVKLRNPKASADLIDTISNTETESIEETKPEARTKPEETHTNKSLDTSANTSKMNSSKAEEELRRLEIEEKMLDAKLNIAKKMQALEELNRIQEQTKKRIRSNNSSILSVSGNNSKLLRANDSNNSTIENVRNGDMSFEGDMQDNEKIKPKDNSTINQQSNNTQHNNNNIDTNFAMENQLNIPNLPIPPIFQQQNMNILDSTNGLIPPVAIIQQQPIPKITLTEPNSGETPPNTGHTENTNDAMEANGTNDKPQNTHSEPAKVTGDNNNDDMNNSTIDNKDYNFNLSLKFNKSITNKCNVEIWEEIIKNKPNLTRESTVRIINKNTISIIGKTKETESYLLSEWPHDSFKQYDGIKSIEKYSKEKYWLKAYINHLLTVKEIEMLCQDYSLVGIENVAPTEYKIICRDRETHETLTNQKVLNMFGHRIKCKPWLHKTQIDQCHNCQQWGHTKEQGCKRKPRCRYCSKSHMSNECPNKDEPSTWRCLNCRGVHRSDDKRCRIYMEHLNRINKVLNRPTIEIPAPIISRNTTPKVTFSDAININNHKPSTLTKVVETNKNKHRLAQTVMICQELIKGNTDEANKIVNNLLDTSIATNIEDVRANLENIA
jgi:hypothetical protein